MFHANVTAVGCYRAFCVDGKSTACVFSHPPPRDGAKVYTPGNPCVSGGNCNSPKVGACEYGLCVIIAGIRSMGLNGMSDTICYMVLQPLHTSTLPSAL
ncbi:hypothetical protein KIN20_025251 [Parelaphostrongylus tenuis]|uniref:Uncharacterized protein n=1 Tax=Parelaphostrongylus tenuis TaxID=148309 RepID=A0AAD5MUW6_PARTN|nr:hypothetical protein KIN20_025251 [Parelaphostrongylus tenuis]